MSDIIKSLQQACSSAAKELKIQGRTIIQLNKQVAKLSGIKPTASNKVAAGKGTKVAVKGKVAAKPAGKVVKGKAGKVLVKTAKTLPTTKGKVTRKSKAAVDEDFMV